MPPFSKIFNIEVKIRDLKDLNMLMINEDTRAYCCIPSKYKNIESFEMALEKYEEELVQETMKPFVPCGHAFVCLDSIYAVEACINKFKLKPKAYLSYLQEFAGSVSNVFRIPLQSGRDRNISTFIKMDEL